MSNFLDIALECVRRGWLIFPCKPNKKIPAIRGYYEAATADEAQVRAWWAKWPDANIGIACGESDLCVIDKDHNLPSREAAVAWVAEVNTSGRLPRTFTVLTGRRFATDDPSKPEWGIQLYYSGAVAGSGQYMEDGQKAGDIQSWGDLVMAPGSVHPKSGERYEILIDAPVAPLPGWVQELQPERKVFDPATSVDLDTVNEWRTWLLEYAAHFGLTVRDHDNRVVNGVWIGIACPWKHSSGEDGEPSSTAIGMLDGKLQFSCLHGSCETVHDTPAFKEEMSRRNKTPFTKAEPGADPVIVMGSGKAQPKAAILPERVRPVYPISAWDGTIVAEFAKLCGADNNIPLKMYAESFRCVLGAVVGDRLSCEGVDGGLPRTYTVIVAPKGKGKGTAIRRAVRFFNQPCDGWSGNGSGSGVRVSFTHGLLSGERDFEWKPKGIGAHMAAASSVPGMSRLCRDLDSTIKNKPHMTWGNTLPRILSVHEEMKTFLSTLFIEGGVGSGMEGVVCQLWDDVTFHGTATGTRDAAYGEMMFSMLCGVTEEDWFDLLSRGNAVGSGLMSRINIIGTEGSFENVSKIKPPEFKQLQSTFLPRVMQLEDAHVRLVPSVAAEDIICEWADNLPEGSERMNIHAWRNALLIAWLRHETVISAQTAEDAVSLGQYQIASHEYYRTHTAANPIARIQADIVRAVEMKKPMKKRELQQTTHASREGTELWNRAFTGLLRDGTLGTRDDGTVYRAE